MLLICLICVCEVSWSEMESCCDSGVGWIVDDEARGAILFWEIDWKKSSLWARVIWMMTDREKMQRQDESARRGWKCSWI